MIRCFRLATLLAVVLLAACSEAPAPKKAETSEEPEKPAEPVTGSSAFFQMFAAARGWAPDIEILNLHSIHLQQVKYEAGKASAWQATFVSPHLRRARSYTYSVIEAEGNLHKGVFAGLEESWSGPRGASKPFIIQALKVNSDAAYATAMKKGKAAAEYTKKNPDKRISFLLELGNRHPNVTWRVVWGESVSASNYSVFVDASTGEYLETAR
ncbi:MAG: hypothetical protein ACRD96_02880 [Bryobacteraceae bacterium]